MVGFYEEKDREKLLRCDKSKTVFSNVEFCPDLTKQQRKQEVNMTEKQGSIYWKIPPPPLGGEKKSADVIWGKKYES